MSTDKHNDCMDEYFECSTNCPPNDPTCHTDCVEEMKECQVPGVDVSDHYHGLIPYKAWDNSHGDLIAELLQIAAQLGGTMERSTRVTSQGTSSQVITIEYNVQTNDKRTP